MQLCQASSYYVGIEATAHLLLLWINLIDETMAEMI